MKRLLLKIESEIINYIEAKEQELRKELKNPVSISQEWNGYLIKMQGHAIRAAHNASTHRWRFIMLKNHGGYYVENYEIYDISEKKGEAIIEFLKALAAVTKKSSGPQALRNEENIGAAVAMKSSQDLQAQGEEIGKEAVY